ncbi:hypothetical protein B0H10DRAFT_1387691 [Mycena sp. CBHHK59/15]|nr:hypothetical protein B0H10DRAFT_1387691 [Mycena sp. CBHHK59/15]
MRRIKQVHEELSRAGATVSPTESQLGRVGLPFQQNGLWISCMMLAINCRDEVLNMIGHPKHVPKALTQGIESSTCLLKALGSRFVRISKELSDGGRRRRRWDRRRSGSPLLSHTAHRVSG